MTCLICCPCLSPQLHGCQPLGSTYRVLSALVLMFSSFHRERERAGAQHSETQLEVNNCSGGPAQHALMPRSPNLASAVFLRQFLFRSYLVLNGAPIISCHFLHPWPALELASGSWPSVTWVLLSAASSHSTAQPTCWLPYPPSPHQCTLLFGSDFITSCCSCVQGSHQESEVL